MQPVHGKNIALVFTLTLSLLVIFISIIGLYSGSFYFAETEFWQIQATGQDIIDLYLVVPVLIVTGVYYFLGNRKAALLWSGALLYLIYTFVIYCFAVHFNSLFVFYCMTLGLSFYAFLWFHRVQLHKPFINGSANGISLRVTGIYFIILSIMFYYLWLSEIIPAIATHTLPESQKETGLFTNPVHVLDLSVILPGLFITGLLLLKKHQLGMILAPAFLVFLILMDITIGLLVLLMKQKNLVDNASIAWIMVFMAIFSMALAIILLKNILPRELPNDNNLSG